MLTITPLVFHIHCQGYGFVSGELLITENSRTTVMVLANDDAYGVFSFETPDSTSVEEGSTIFYKYGVEDLWFCVLPF